MPLYSQLMRAGVLTVCTKLRIDMSKNDYLSIYKIPYNIKKQIVKKYTYFKFMKLSYHRIFYIV